MSPETTDCISVCVCVTAGGSRTHVHIQININPHQPYDLVCEFVILNNKSDEKTLQVGTQGSAMGMSSIYLGKDHCKKGKHVLLFIWYCMILH